MINGQYYAQETGLYIGYDDNSSSSGTILRAGTGAVLSTDNTIYQSSGSTLRSLRVDVETRTGSGNLMADSLSGTIRYDATTLRLYENITDTGTGYIMPDPRLVVDEQVTRVMKDANGNETGELRFSIDRPNVILSNNNNPLFTLRFIPVGSNLTITSDITINELRFLSTADLAASPQYPYLNANTQGASMVPLRVDTDGTVATVETLPSVDPANPGGSTTTETIRDQNGNPIQETVTERDADGNIIRETVREYWPDTNILQRETITEYYPNGGGVHTVTVHDYNQQGTPVQTTVTTYDPDGSIDSVVTTQYYSDGVTPHFVTTDIYNPDGTITRTIVEYGPDGTTVLSTTVQQIDENGRILSETITSPDGTVETRTYTYNPDGTYTIDVIRTLPDGTIVRETETCTAAGVCTVTGTTTTLPPSTQAINADSADQQFRVEIASGAVLLGDTVTISTTPRASIANLPANTQPVTNAYTAAGTGSNGQPFTSILQTPNGAMTGTLMYSTANIPQAPTGTVLTGVALYKQLPNSTTWQLVPAASITATQAEFTDTSLGTYVLLANYGPAPTPNPTPNTNSNTPTTPGSGGGGGGSAGGGAASGGGGAYFGGSGGGGTPDTTTPVILPDRDTGEAIIAYGPLKFDRSKGYVNVPVRHLEYPFGYEAQYEKGTLVTAAGQPFTGTIYPLSKYPLSRLQEPMKSALPAGYTQIGDQFIQYGDLKESFSKPVKIVGALPKRLSELASNTGNVVILTWDFDSKSWKKVGDANSFNGEKFTVNIDKSSIVAVFEINGSTPTLSSCEDPKNLQKTPFPDANAHWAANFICNLYQKGAISGYAAGPFRGLFKPDNQVTRAELVKIVLAARGEDISTAAVNTGFSDVSPTEWYARYVSRAKQLGIVAGYTDGTFKPNTPVNRAEALKIILLGSSKVSQTDIDEAKIAEGADADRITAGFADVSESEWFSSYLSFASKSGIISGKSAGRFAAGDNMTRAEVAKVVSLAVVLE